MKNNTYTLYDSLFGFIPFKTESNFVQRGSTENRLSQPGANTGDPTQIMTMGIWIDTNYDTYRRDVYSFNLVLRDVGGLYTAIFSMGLFLSWIFRDTLFFTALISKLYEVENVRNRQKRNKPTDLEDASEGADDYV